MPTCFLETSAPKNNEQDRAFCIAVSAKIAELVNKAMTEAIIEARVGFEKEQKRLEAKAKRDAKKAANGVQ